LVSSKTFVESLNKYIDQEINPGINYYYQLRVLKDKDEYLHTDWISASLQPEIEQWSCYPNPVNESLSVLFELTSSMDLQFRVIDITGKTIFQSERSRFDAGSSVYPVDVASIPAGIFLITIETEKYMLGRRVFIKE
jgi:hypothetical protein